MNVPRTVVSLVFVLSTTALADGRIFGTHFDIETLAPRGGGSVRLEGPALPRPIEVAVDPNGHYAVIVPAGSYRLTFVAPDHRPYSTTVRVRSNVSIRENFILCPTAANGECDYVYARDRMPIDVGSAVQQVELSSFLPDRSAWAPATPSRQLFAPRVE